MRPDGSKQFFWKKVDTRPTSHIQNLWNTEKNIYNRFWILFNFTVWIIQYRI